MTISVRVEWWKLPVLVQLIGPKGQVKEYLLRAGTKFGAQLIDPKKPQR